MKVVKFSPIYGNNIGDIAISKCIEHAFSKYGVTVCSKDLFFREPGSFINKTKSDSLRIKVSTYLQLNFPHFFYILKKIAFRFSNDQNKIRVVSSGFDAVIFGGGNILMSNLGSDYAYRVSSYCKAIDKKTIIFSAGAGPFPFERKKLTHELILNSSFLSVRDKNSLSYFKELGADESNIMIDPAFIISDLYPKEDCNKKYLGVNIISNYFNDQELELFAISVYKFCIEKDLKLKLINTAYPVDPISADKFRSYILKLNPNMDCIVVNTTLDLSSIECAYRDVQYFLGARMHSLIFALSYGIPAVGIAWDKKVPAMFEQFLGKKHKDVILGDDLNIGFDVYNQISLEERLDLTKNNIYNNVEKVIDMFS
ncbi:TPA: polysaccharide pyruvyl transferase family protein [Vibrio vulnificus]|nr:polysaccharide pyruvyl transferase family protein [Vibrio vulnificus]HDY7687589.1 polysaccharide pyruvyl transferase family protein [Vibrio vulnificus]